MDGASDEAQRKRNGIDVLGYLLAGSRRQALHHHIFLISITAPIDMQQCVTVLQLDESQRPAVFDEGGISVYVAVPINLANGYQVAEESRVGLHKRGTGKPVDADAACKTAVLVKVVFSGLNIEVTCFGNVMPIAKRNMQFVEILNQIPALLVHWQTVVHIHNIVLQHYCSGGIHYAGKLRNLHIITLSHCRAIFGIHDFFTTQRMNECQALVKVLHLLVT